MRNNNILFIRCVSVRNLLERMGKTLFFRSGGEPLILSEEQRDARRQGGTPTILITSSLYHSYVCYVMFCYTQWLYEKIYLYAKHCIVGMSKQECITSARQDLSQLLLVK